MNYLTMIPGSQISNQKPMIFAQTDLYTSPITILHCKSCHLFSSETGPYRILLGLCPRNQQKGYLRRAQESAGTFSC